MKKTLSIVLALVMVLSLSAFAFAADITPTGDSSKDVTGTYTAGSDNVGTVWSVTISWNVTAGVYQGVGGTYAWDPTNLKYTESTAPSVTATTPAKVEVTVTNRSNAALTASVAYENKLTTTTSSGTWAENKQSATIGSAAVNGGSEISYNDTTTAGTEQSGTFTCNISVADASKLGTDTVLGTVTVTLVASTGA